MGPHIFQISDLYFIRYSFFSYLKNDVFIRSYDCCFGFEPVGSTWCNRHFVRDDVIRPIENCFVRNCSHPGQIPPCLFLLSWSDSIMERKCLNVYVRKISIRIQCSRCNPSSFMHFSIIIHMKSQTTRVYIVADMMERFSHHGTAEVACLMNQNAWPLHILTCTNPHLILA